MKSVNRKRDDAKFNFSIGLLKVLHEMDLAAKIIHRSNDSLIIHFK